MIATTVRDFEIRVVIRSRKHSVRIESVEICAIKHLFAVLYVLYSLQNRVVIRNAEYGVNFGKFLFESICVSLRKATSHNDFFALARIFCGNRAQNLVYGFFFCFVDKCAGVDDDNVGFFLAADERVSAAHEAREHFFGIYPVFIATERYCAYSHSSSSSL